jgi:hypothetical protein
MLRLGEAGLQDSHKLEPFIDNVKHEGHIRDNAKIVEEMAVELDYINSPPDPKKGDIHGKLYLLEDQEFKRLLNSSDPTFGKWINEQLDKGL